MERSLPYRDGTTGKPITCDHRHDRRFFCEAHATKILFDHNGTDWWYCDAHAPDHAEIPEEE